MNIMIETSARHIHVKQSDLDILYGAGYVLTKKKDLSQPGQYVCEERLTVIGKKREITGISIIGPTRVATQVEISLTDARSLGIDAPVRESGDVAGSAGCILSGPAGEVTLNEGVIAAQRHLHCTPEDSTALELYDKQIVKIKCDSNGRGLTFDDVIVRVNSTYATSVHIDTDEANAAGGAVFGEIIKS